MSFLWRYKLLRDISYFSSLLFSFCEHIFTKKVDFFSPFLNQFLLPFIMKYLEMETLKIKAGLLYTLNNV